MKVLVAGGTGVIGRLLVPLLTAQGYEVIVLSRHAGKVERNVKQVTADVFDRDGLFATLKEEAPHVIVHLLTDLKEQNSAANARIRDIGTRNLVDAAKAGFANKIVAQSIAWAYEPGGWPATEYTALDLAAQLPRKATVDGIVSLEGAVCEMPQHTILRLGTLYGPGTWYERGGSIAQAVQAGKMTATSAITNFLHVQDAASAFLQALRWPEGPVNIVDGDPATGLVWLPEYARELEARMPEVATDTARNTRAVANTKACELGWTPAYPSWRNGLL